MYAAEDNATVDKDNKTGAKVIETGVTELMRLEYSLGLCQSYWDWGTSRLAGFEAHRPKGFAFIQDETCL